ncbi:O-antigen ligase family protein [bacterium]
MPEHSRYLLSQSKSLHVFSMFGNSNLLAGHLAIILPAAIYGALTEKSRKTKLFFIASAAFMFLSIFATGSRSAAMTALAGILFIMVLLFFPRHGTVKKLVSILIVFGCLGAAVFFYTGSDIPGKHGSIKLRTMYWKSAFEMFREKPLGTGPGTYRLRYLDFQKSYFEGEHPEELEKLALLEKPRHPHNEFLNMLAESGLPAVLFFTLMIVAGISGSVRKSREESDKTAWGAMLVSFAVVASFGFPLLVPVTGFLLPLCLAAIGSPDNPEKELKGALSGSTARILLAGIIVISGAYLADRQFDPLRARISLTGARRSVNVMDLPSAKKNIYAALDIYPDMGESLFVKGVIQVREGRNEDALKSFVKAKKTSNDMNLDINISLIQRALGMKTEAEETINRVIKTLPADPGPRKILANFYLQDFEYKKALKTMKEAERLQPGNPELLEMIRRVEEYIAETGQGAE